MTKHLMIDGTNNIWRLPEAVDLPQLSRNVEAAMIDGEVMQIPVVLDDEGDAPITLLLNCGAAAAVAFVEL